MYYMTPTCTPQWSPKGLRAVLRDALPESDLASESQFSALEQRLHGAVAIDAPAAAEARRARVERMGQRLKQLVHAADAETPSSVAA